MELVQVVQRKVRAHVTVQHEKCVRIAGTNVVTEVIHAASRAQHGELLQIAKTGDKRIEKKLPMHEHFRDLFAISMETDLFVISVKIDLFPIPDRMSHTKLDLRTNHAPICHYRMLTLYMVCMSPTNFSIWAAG